MWAWHWPALPTIPTPRQGRGERVLPSIFQTSRSPAKESFIRALQVQWQVPGQATLRHQNTDNLPMAAANSQVEAHVSTPSLTHISPINAQFCSTHGDSHSSLCTQHTKSAQSSGSQPNPTDGTTVACKVQHTPTTLGPT